MRSNSGSQTSVGVAEDADPGVQVAMSGWRGATIRVSVERIGVERVLRECDGLLDGAFDKAAFWEVNDGGK